MTLINEKSGAIRAVNKRAFHRWPYFLLTQPGTNQATAPNTVVIATNNQSSVPTMMTVSGEGPMLVTAIMLEDTSGGVFLAPSLVTMSVQSKGITTALMSAPVRTDLIFGSFMGASFVTYNAGMFVLPVPILLGPDESLVIRYTNLQVAGSLSYRTSFIGARYTNKQYMKAKSNFEMNVLPFFYTFVPDNPSSNSSSQPVLGAAEVGAGATIQEQIPVSSESHFLLTHLMEATFVAGDTLTMNIKDANTGSSLFTAPADQNFAINPNIFTGNGLWPSVLSHPWLFKAGSKISVTVTNGGAATSDLWIVLGGKLIPPIDWE